MLDFVKSGRRQALWRFMQASSFRNYVLAAKHRAEDMFETRESANKAFAQTAKLLQEQRISYSLFEDPDIEQVYPRAFITNGGRDLEVGDLAKLWHQACLVLLENPPQIEGTDSALKRYYRLALFDLTKHQFKSEQDVAEMATYYTLAKAKIKEIKIAPETQVEIDKLIAEKQNVGLIVTYLKYKMRAQWREGLFQAAVQTQQALCAQAETSPYDKLAIAESFYIPALYAVLQQGQSTVLDTEKELETFKVHSEQSSVLKIKALYLRGLDCLYNSRNFEQAREIFHEALSQCDRMSDASSKWTSLCLCEQARCEYYMKN